MCDCTLLAISAAVSVSITVPLTAAISVCVTVIIMYCCGFISRRKSPLSDHKQETKSAGLEVDGNLAYGQVNYIVGNRTSSSSVAPVTESDYVDCQI